MMIEAIDGAGAMHQVSSIEDRGPRRAAPDARSHLEPGADGGDAVRDGLTSAGENSVHEVNGGFRR